jgi:hypothetical protein
MHGILSVFNTGTRPGCPKRFWILEHLLSVGGSLGYCCSTWRSIGADSCYKTDQKNLIAKSLRQQFPLWCLQWEINAIFDAFLPEMQAFTFALAITKESSRSGAIEA